MPLVPRVCRHCMVWLMICACIADTVMNNSTGDLLMTLSTLRDLSEGNQPVRVELPNKLPVIWSFGAFFCCMPKQAVGQTVGSHRTCGWIKTSIFYYLALLLKTHHSSEEIDHYFAKIRMSHTMAATLEWFCRITWPVSSINKNIYWLDHHSVEK